MYEETDGPGPEGEYDDEDYDLINFDDGARVPDHAGGAVGDDTVSVSCQPGFIMKQIDMRRWILMDFYVLCFSSKHIPSLQK